MTNAGEHVLELRALMSAVDAPTAFDLRCEVREKLVAFLKETYPESLPRVRAEFLKEGGVEIRLGETDIRDRRTALNNEAK